VLRKQAAHLGVIGHEFAQLQDCRGALVVSVLELTGGTRFNAAPVDPGPRQAVLVV
jgi:hypothetical protein